MAITTNLTDLGTEAIEEYLHIADHCLQTQKGSGPGVYGYPAALLLFCVMDALGHGVNGPSGGTDFSLFTQPPFGLTTGQADKLAKWYRHKLAHAAILSPGVWLTDDHGAPFEFNANGEPIQVRLPVFAGLVRSAWAAHQPRFQPRLATGEPTPSPTLQPPGFASTLTPAASGTT